MESSPPESNQEHNDEVVDDLCPIARAELDELKQRFMERSTDHAMETSPDADEASGESN